MAERDATGGRTPGPGSRGGGGNTSAAAASRIRVDISDVSKLKSALSATQTEAKKLSETLAKFDDRAIKAVRAAREEIEKLQRALGSSSARGVSGPKNTTTSSGGGIGSANDNAGTFTGGQQTHRGGSSYLPRPPGSAYDSVVVGGMPGVNLLPAGATSPSLMQRGVSYLTTPSSVVGRDGAALSMMQQARNTPLYGLAAAGLGAITSVAGLAAGHLAPATSRSYLANQLTLASGGSMSIGNQMNVNAGLTARFGGTGINYADYTQGASTLAATGATAGAAGQARFGSAGLLSAINPTQGLGASAQQVAGLFTSQNYYAQRIAGIQMNPNNQNVGQLFDQIISRYESQVGRKLTPQEIQSAAQQGSPLNVTVTAMGISADLMPQLIRYWMAKNRTGKTGMAAAQAASQGTLFHGMQQRGSAVARAQGNFDKGFMPGATAAANVQTAAINAMGDLAGTPFGKAMGEAAGGLAVFASELKLASGALKTIVAWSIAQRVLGGGGGGVAGGRLGGLATRAGGALFGEGAVTVGGSSLGAVGGVVALDAVAVGTAAKGVSNLPHDFAGLGLNDKVKNLYGSFYKKASPQQKAVLDRYRGSIVAGLAATQHQSIWDKVTGNVHTKKLEDAVAQLQQALGQTGDSGQDANIWGGSGQTFKTLEQMASKGPHEIVTSTTGGKHATNSYHYKGQAIDLADKVGSVDSPGLLAINQYLAKNYGHKLAELIYAGPGGVNIKNGKVVSGLGTYGSATMAEHHNHVHMAATPASLGMSGGVDVGGGGAGGPSSASSSGGFSSPASSGLGMGDLFRTSSGDALLAALAGGIGGGGGGGGGGRAGGSAPGGGQGSAGASGGPPGALPKGNLAQWERQGLSLVGLGYNRYAPGLTKLISHESAGNPRAINLWDSNAKAGHPSKGLMQEIDSTFNAYALPGHKNIWNPVDNIAAGVRYIEHTYGLGMLQAGGRHDAHGNYIGYARGVAEVLRDEMAQLHKGEMVLAAPEATAVRQLVAKSNATGASTGGGRGVTVPVQLIFQVMSGGEAEARAHAARFARFVAEDHDISMVAAR